MIRIEKVGEDGYKLIETLTTESGATTVNTTAEYDSKGMVDYINNSVVALTNRKVQLQQQIVNLNNTISEFMDMVTTLQGVEEETEKVSETE